MTRPAITDAVRRCPPFVGVRQCPTCRGTGHIEITGVYAETLALLRRHPGLNAAQLARMAPCKGTAMANRLAALEAFGLARGVPYGRQRLWEAVG